MHPTETILGLERTVVRLIPWTIKFRVCFAREAVRLREALGERVGPIEHVGSTAIPGIAAKPIIDMMAAVPSSEAGLALADALDALGYGYHDDPHVPDRAYYVRRDPAGRSTHHLSLASTDSHFWQTQLLFRDYLSDHPRQRQAYEALKRDLCTRFRSNRPMYPAGKSAFCDALLAEAGWTGGPAPGRSQNA